jgi:hypothetical protein
VKIPFKQVGRWIGRVLLGAAVEEGVVRIEQQAQREPAPQPEEKPVAKKKKGRKKGGY